MGRFLAGVLFAVGLWWAYDRFFATDGEVLASEPAVVSIPGLADGGDDFRATGASPDDEAVDRAGGLPSGAVVDAGAGVGAGAAPADFVAARASAGIERERALAAAVRAVRDAPTAVEARVALGATNAFLHVPEGRDLAIAVMEKIEALPPWEAARESTRLLESAMNGPISNGDGEALATFRRLAERHGMLAARTVLSPGDLTGARRYEVVSGDNLERIAQRMRKTLAIRLEAGTLQVLNRIDDPRRLSVGHVLKVPVDPIRTVVHKGSFTVAVYVGDVIVRTYRCAHGKPSSPGADTETPCAHFLIDQKIENPDWHHGGRVVPFGAPDNPLGTHFIGFEHPVHQSLGIHGTNDPQSIGTRASLGCIRLAERDVLEFFRLVARVTSVDVVE